MRREKFCGWIYSWCWECLLGAIWSTLANRAYLTYEVSRTLRMNQDCSLPANHERQVSADVATQRLQTLAAGKHHGSLAANAVAAPDQHSKTDSLSIWDQGQFAYNRIKRVCWSCMATCPGLTKCKIGCSRENVGRVKNNCLLFWSGYL